MTIGLRAFAESTAFCGFGSSLSPLVRAILDAADGVKLSLPADACARHFGCTGTSLPRRRHRIVAVRAGRRGGKSSRLLAPAAVHAAWTVPVPTLAVGEPAYAVLVCPDVKTARHVLSFVKGLVEQSPILRAARREETAEHVELERVDGVRVRIEVLAASRRTGRSRTLVFAGIDEGCFFDTGDDAAVSDTEVVRALLPALVPDAQLWTVSSPWIEGVGYIESLFARDFGKHANALCVSAPTKAMHPGFDPDGSIERELRESDPMAAARELDAIPLAGGSEVLFDPGAIARCVDHERADALPSRGTWAACAVDLGFTKDGAAQCIAYPGDPIEVAFVDLMLPKRNQPLQFGEVVARFAENAKRYGCRHVIADSFNRAAAITEFERHGLGVVPAPEGQSGKAETHLAAKRLVHECRVRLPNDQRLLVQMRSILTKPTAGGKLSFTTRRVLGQGHGDAASAAILAIWACRGEGLSSGPLSSEAIARAFSSDVKPMFDSESEAA